MHICVCGIHEYIIWILYKIKTFRWTILDWVLVKLHLLSQSWAWEVTGPSQQLSLSVTPLCWELLSSFAGSQQSQGLGCGRSRGLGHTETPPTQPPEWLQPSGWKPWASQWRFHSLGSEVLRLLKKKKKKACLRQRTEIAAMILHLLTAQWWVC